MPPQTVGRKAFACKRGSGGLCFATRTPCCEVTKADQSTITLRRPIRPLGALRGGVIILAIRGYSYPAARWFRFPLAARLPR